MKLGRNISKEIGTAGEPDNKPLRETKIDLPAIDQLRSNGFAVQKLLEIQNADKRLGKEHRRHLLNNLANVYAVATALRADKDIWLEFYRHDSWRNFRGRPKLDDNQDALKYAIRLMVGFRDKANTQRASKYYRALTPLFQEGVKPTDVVKKIKKAGGIEKLASQNAQRRQAKGPNVKLPALVTRKMEIAARPGA